jgi:hypothetical protein
MQRWDLWLVDIGLSTRALRALQRHDLIKAWHAAALCQSCISRTYQCGRKTRMEIYDVLQRHGFPALRRDCDSHPWHGTSACERTLAQCRAMLERGEWG